LRLIYTIPQIVSSHNGDAEILPQAVKHSDKLLVSVNYFFQYNLITLIMHLSSDYVMQNPVSASDVFLTCTIIKTNIFIASTITRLKKKGAE